MNADKRGICPLCSSVDVIHLVIGMPAGPDVRPDDPEWVRWVGCVHTGYTRCCESCGGTWTPGVTYADAAALMAHAGAEDLEDLCVWLSTHHEQDAWVLTDNEDPDYLEIGFGNVGMIVDFPVGSQALSSALDELHEEAEALLGRSVEE